MLTQERLDDINNYVVGDWFQVQSTEELEAFYLSRLPYIKEAAQVCGYAIAVHGSLKRDFDLIAVPWVDQYHSINVLARMIATAACGMSRSKPYDWETKPNGRMAASIPICWTPDPTIIGAGHIDLSVIGINKDLDTGDAILVTAI